MTKVVVDETEWSQMDHTLHKQHEEIARLEVENRNLKRENEDLKRKVDKFEIDEIHEKRLRGVIDV